MCNREQSQSRGASQSAVRRRWLNLCTVWSSHSQWPSEQISFITTIHLPILQLSCRLLWQSFASRSSVSPPNSPDLAPCDFWLFTKLKSPLKGVVLWTQRSHSTQAQSTESHCRLTSPTGEWLFTGTQWGLFWLIAKLHQGHATSSRDNQNG